MNFCRMETAGVLWQLRVFLQKMEAQVEEAKNLEAARMALKSMPGLAEYQMERDEHRQIFERVLPRYLRYSFVVLLFSVLETELDRASAKIAKRKSLSLGGSERSGKLLEKASSLLEKLGRPDLTSGPMWEALHNLKKVRDCIVHAGGEVGRSRDKDHLRRLADGTQVKGLSICKWEQMWQDEGRLEIAPSFCVDSLEQVRAFFDQIYDAAGFGPAEPQVET